MLFDMLKRWWVPVSAPVIGVSLGFLLDEDKSWLVFFIALAICIPVSCYVYSRK
jgi:hypothetical protein